FSILTLYVMTINPPLRLVFLPLSGCDRLVDRLLHHKVEGWVDELVEEVEGLENQQVEFVVELVINVVKEVTEVLMSKEFCPNNEMQKLEIEFWCHAMVRAGHAAYTNRFYELFRLVPHLVTLENKELRGYFAKDCRARPKVVTPISARNLTTAQGACFECGGTNHYKAAGPRLNRAPRTRGNRQDQLMAIGGGQGRENNGNQAHGGACMMGADEAHQDPNILTVSTTFMPLLHIKPSDLGFSYEIEITSGQLIEINKESFDVIVRIDWLSRHKAKIIFHKMVVRISLPHGEILRVLGEKPKEKVRHLMSAKTEEPKLKDIVVVRNFPEVFPEDLSGFPPS
nr:hypothetical protein [Tanacetum cinerariifolium]GEW27125.1 hypothetical protein [Tanacetum cinerariifolium]